MLIDQLPSILPELVAYDPMNGKLTWLPRTAAHFRRTNSPDKRCAAWNRRCAGNAALESIGSHGYKTGRIFDIQVLAHRVILAMHLGRWPVEVDHINGVRTDNRLVNLREVTRQENVRNRRLSEINQSGIIGVYWAPHARKWRAEIKDEGTRRHLGYFTSKNAAAEARKAAERAFGFHANHGRPA